MSKMVKMFSVFALAVVMALIFLPTNVCFADHENFQHFKDSMKEMGFVYTGVDKNGIFSFEKTNAIIGVSLKTVSLMEVL